MVDSAPRKGRSKIILASGPRLDRLCARDANAHAADQRGLARMRGCAPIWLFASAMIALSTAETAAAPSHKHVPTQARKTPEAEHHKTGSAADAKRSTATQQSEPKRATHAVPLPIPRPAAANAAIVLPPEMAATKQAIELVRQRKLDEATALAASIGDPLAQKLIEWALLRSSDGGTRFESYAAFIRDNRDWPSISLLRRHAEEGCGGRGPTPQRCVVSSMANRPVRRVGSRWHAY